MNINTLLFLFSCIILTSSNSNFYSINVKIIKGSYFQPPVDTHLIDTLINIPSIKKCALICERHNICRTADYNITTNTCRLFETLTSAGAFVADPTTNILPFNYCTNDQQIEPYYVCTRGNTYTVQQIFDQLALAPNITLSASITSIYANMYGLYLGTTGSLSFLTYTGINSSYISFPTQITGINAAPNNGLGIVQYLADSATIYKNIGTLLQPQLVSILNISLPYQPYSCLITSQYIYITYMNSYVYMTIHDLSTGSLLFSTPSVSLMSERPVVNYWNDAIIVLDQYMVMEYTLNGTYKGNLPYFNGTEVYGRHCIQYDYAGRRHICNANNGYGLFNGIYTLLMNGTQIARGPTLCFRAVQVYITKDQAILTNMLSSGPAIMNVINF
ncbi:unnamed protein product [Adineta steineri]|uniref:Apple domain-containing protein n=1 Tax=Adineta steineri TaxID=433720 RepID=A0A815I122_9BILA|nr:unnamed protein product [Adineta steineri]CAF4017022.1 unnamed protein product [Adineta steineri]